MPDNTIKGFKPDVTITQEEAMRRALEAHANANKAKEAAIKAAEEAAKRLMNKPTEHNNIYFIDERNPLAMVRSKLIRINGEDSNCVKMFDKLVNQEELPIKEELAKLAPSSWASLCHQIKKHYLAKFPNDEDKLILTDDSIKNVKPIVEEYFKEKDGTLQFEKDCL